MDMEDRIRKQEMAVRPGADYVITAFLFAVVAAVSVYGCVQATGTKAFWGLSALCVLCAVSGGLSFLYYRRRRIVFREDGFTVRQWTGREMTYSYESLSEVRMEGNGRRQPVYLYVDGRRVADFGEKHRNYELAVTKLKLHGVKVIAGTDGEAGDLWVHVNRKEIPEFCQKASGALTEKLSKMDDLTALGVSLLCGTVVIQDSETRVYLAYPTRDGGFFASDGKGKNVLVMRIPLVTPNKRFGPEGYVCNSNYLGALEGYMWKDFLKRLKKCAASETREMEIEEMEGRELITYGDDIPKRPELSRGEI